MVRETERHDLFRARHVVAAVRAERRDVVAQEIPFPVRLLYAHARVEAGVLAVARDGEFCAHASAHVEPLSEGRQDVRDHVVAEIRFRLAAHAAEADAARAGEVGKGAFRVVRPGARARAERQVDPARAVRKGFRLDPAVLPEGVVADASRHGVRAGAAGAAGIEPVEGRDAFVGARATGELAERAFSRAQFARRAGGVSRHMSLRPSV